MAGRGRSRDPRDRGALPLRLRRLVPTGRAPDRGRRRARPARGPPRAEPPLVQLGAVHRPVDQRGDGRRLRRRRRAQPRRAAGGARADRPERAGGGRPQRLGRAGPRVRRLRGARGVRLQRVVLGDAAARRRGGPRRAGRAARARRRGGVGLRGAGLRGPALPPLRLDGSRGPARDPARLHPGRGPLPPARRRPARRRLVRRAGGDAGAVPRARRALRPVGPAGGRAHLDDELGLRERGERHAGARRAAPVPRRPARAADGGRRRPRGVRAGVRDRPRRGGRRGGARGGRGGHGGAGGGHRRRRRRPRPAGHGRAADGLARAHPR